MFRPMRPDGAGLVRRHLDRKTLLAAGEGVPIATEKKQRTWPEAPVPPLFSFSKPVSERLIREVTFQNGYRESRSCEITWFDPKVLWALDYRHLRERL